MTSSAHAQTLVGDPFVTGFESWTSTFSGTPVAGDQPSWGTLLTTLPTGTHDLVEDSDGRAGDGSGADGLYTPYLLINSADTTPATYDLSATLASFDNDGMGIVFGYQDNNNYFRAGMRNQSPANLGFPDGASVQKVVNGVITPLGVDAGTFPLTDGTPFDMEVSVNGNDWALSINNTPVLNGTDADLQPGKYGVQSWGSTSTFLQNISVASTTLNKNHTFGGALSSVNWRALQMTNAEAGQNNTTTGLGTFHQNFINGTIDDGSNGFVFATATAPNVDFIGPSVVVDEAGATSWTDYRMTVRMENGDDDGIGLLVRAADDDSFYRINFATQGIDTGGQRAPRGMSIQKNDNGTWSEVFRDDQANPKFLFSNDVPFDVAVSVVGPTIQVQVVNDPDGSPTAINYDPVTDNSSPILAGSVGFTNWGSDQTIYSPYRGNSDALLTAITELTDLKLTVNRNSGNITLTNNGAAAVDIRGVSILSNGGALNPTNWLSVADNYDEPPGNGTVDPDDPWTEITANATELSEAEQSGGDGGTLGIGQSVNLGNIWLKSRIEDVALEVELVSGGVIGGEVEYLFGPGGMAYHRSDLNTDGVVDANDWPLFFPNMLANLGSMTTVEQVLAGDIDGDGDNDVDDFALFKFDFNQFNGGGSFERMLQGVPEPSSILLLLAGCLGLLCRRRRGVQRAAPLLSAVVVMAALANSASATAVDFTTYTLEAFPPANRPTFQDPVWTLTPTTATHNSNADANVLYSPGSVLNKRFIGTLTPGTDDDVVGFVLGFQPGDAQIFSSADYLLIDWKGVTQTFNFADGDIFNFHHDQTDGGSMPVGLALSRVTNSPTADELWQHINDANNPTGGVAELARGATLGSSAYNRTNGSHLFDITYSSTQITVSVDGVEQFNVSGSFPDGRFGLYSAWQGPTATFSNFEELDLGFAGLSATVDRSDGTVTLHNEGSVPVDFDFYQFSSQGNSLNTGGWNSLSAQNFQPVGAGTGQRWQEAGGSDSGELAEVYLQSNSTLAPMGQSGDSIEIGQAYNHLINAEDLMLTFRLPGSGLILEGDVDYIGVAPGLPGDYNNNGKVDAADYVLWRKDPASHGGNPGGYNTWRNNFGAMAGSGSGANSESHAAVPEPASILLLSVGILSLVCAIPRRKVSTA